MAFKLGMMVDLYMAYADAHFNDLDLDTIGPAEENNI